MTTFTWTIRTLERVIESGVVLKAQLNLLVEKDGAQGNRAASVVFPSADAETAGFIPYADLTEEVVLEWAMDALGEEQKADIEAYAEAQLDERLAPVVEQGLPW